MIAYFCFSILLESSTSLCIYDFLEVAWVDRTDDVDKKLPRRSLLRFKIIVQVLLDIIVILDFINQLVHTQLSIKWYCDSVDILALEACFITAQELTNELAVDIIVLVEMAFAT